ncbi:MAG: 3-dehydroquinate synthase [Micavibrio aeruginosavorus]|uniref:3-dehydroquinate synthase n=1 Tax=Micavibrio aeruginosavorus TaxID=349221 RepID=A0A7T5R149_9BACT|nr:MAG: 3-dehydroquinate synthase [Micavibrio aeruginosavorus]
MSIEKLHVALADHAYDIVIGSGLLSKAQEWVPEKIRRGRIFILTDENAGRHYAASLQAAFPQASILTLPHGEQNKSYQGLERVLDWLLDGRADRRSLLIALGGGVIGDLGGLAAALVLRGIPYVQIPTTLLAQVDSSVGGKTAIDTRQGKNLVGAFYQPVAVIADLDTLTTLPDRERRAGYAEIVKYAFIRDRQFFSWLQENGDKVLKCDPAALTQAVKTSCAHKAEIVAADEKEQNDLRALLNFGHTFGHALEKLLDYDGRLLHGEAVAIGMMLAFDLSVRLGLCPESDRHLALNHLRRMGLKTSIDQVPALADCVTDNILQAMLNDKKAEGGVSAFIVCCGIGQARVYKDISAEVVRTVIQSGRKAAA